VDFEDPLPFWEWVLSFKPRQGVIDTFQLLRWKVESGRVEIL
jgi:hypothetical protein